MVFRKFGTQSNLGLDLVPRTLHTAQYHKLCPLIVAPLIKSHTLLVTCDYLSTLILRF